MEHASVVHNQDVSGREANAMRELARSLDGEMQVTKRAALPVGGVERREPRREEEPWGVVRALENGRHARGGSESDHRGKLEGTKLSSSFPREAVEE